jgi:hypothetical protein
MRATLNALTNDIDHRPDTLPPELDDTGMP